MLPLINIVPIPILPQPSLVDTAIPGNTAQRVPYDNAQPPVSSPRTEPDARYNAQIILPTVPSVDSPKESVSFTEARGFAGKPFGAPTTLIAQLLAQPTTEHSGRQLQLILQEYEKLIANSQIKYKPSNATKPEVVPAGIFGKLLQEAGNKTSRNSAKIVETAVNTLPQINAALPPRAASRVVNNQQNLEDAPPEGAEDTSVISPVHAIPAQAIRSYQQSITRNDTELANL